MAINETFTDESGSSATTTPIAGVSTVSVSGQSSTLSEWGGKVELWLIPENGTLAQDGIMLRESTADDAYTVPTPIDAETYQFVVTDIAGTVRVVFGP